MPSTLYSDTPIGESSPIEWVWIAVYREGQSGRFLHRVRVPVHDALKMITINAVYAVYVLGVDDKIESIEPGSLQILQY